MVRRTHKKSRNGCLECKRRHVKCDETRPVCSNCRSAERECGYGSRYLFAPARHPASQSPRPTPTPALSPVPADSPASGSVSGHHDQPVNILHIELMHNLYTNTYATFDPTKAIPWLPALIAQSISTPYLANELLAFSALQMSTLHPERQDYYHFHAAQLQTHALALFNESNPQVNQDTCIPLFLFSGTLGVHMLCDTLIYRDRDPDAGFILFLSRFTHYLRLHRGVRTIVGQAWPLLQDSIAKPAFEIGMQQYHFNGQLNQPLDALLRRVESSNLGADFTNTYRQAIESLQICMNVTEAAADVRHPEINGVITWSVLVDLKFSDMLEKRRPEALLILAHYAVLLHRFRDSWLFGDSGAFIVTSVRQYLGPEWEDWLEWPVGVLSSGTVP